MGIFQGKKDENKNNCDCWDRLLLERQPLLLKWPSALVEVRRQSRIQRVDIERAALAQRSKSLFLII